MITPERIALMEEVITAAKVVAHTAGVDFIEAQLTLADKLKQLEIHDCEQPAARGDQQ